MAEDIGYIYEFDGFRVIPLEGLLLCNGKAVALQPRAFAVLALLVERHGHLVPKSELIEVVWNDTIVEEAAVSRCVWTIRQALGENSKSSRYIQTIPRRGYRFVAPVTVLNDPSKISSHTKYISTGYRLPIEAKEDVIGRAPAPPQASLERPRFRRPRALAAYSAITLVLLSGVGLYLAVNGRNIFGQEQANAAAPQDSTLDSLPSGTNNEEAYRNYRQAMTLLDQQRPGVTIKAREYLDRAVELDPNYAKAWAGKAYAFSLIWGEARPSEPEDIRERYERSMEAAKRALTIDPNVSEAYTSLCENKFAYEYDSDEAEKDCKRAIELDPESPPAHTMYSMLLSSLGQHEQALSQIRTAMELEPASLRNQRIYANALYYAGRYGEAITVYKRLLDLNPEAPSTHVNLIRSLERSGREPEAFEILLRLLILQKKDASTVQRFKAAYESSAWHGVINERIKTELQEKSPQYSVVAELYGLLGEKDKAFEYLRKNSQKRGWMKMFLRVDPRFDSLRGDPRFADIIRPVEEK
jgi:DNA-binding winged helix-turn-helix (wHTH) protein/tetratricopeptide (TPR) repeat protein